MKIIQFMREEEGGISEEIQIMKQKGGGGIPKEKLKSERVGRRVRVRERDQPEKQIDRWSSVKKTRQEKQAF